MTTDASRDPELFDALAAAYALIAAADNEVAEIEVQRLREWALGHGFDGSDLDELESRCRTIGQGILTHPEKNREIALARVRAIDPNGKRAALVLEVARVAVVADRGLEEQEEGVLKEVAEALGVDPHTA